MTDSQQTYTYRAGKKVALRLDGQGARDITHSYIGDLRPTFIAPSGTVVVLHDRNGGNANDIKHAFDLGTMPGLSAFAGQSLQGDWTLHIQDLAPGDMGQLKRWELEVEGRARADGLIELQEAPGVTIPDNNLAGITRTLNVAATGRVKEVEVAVEITHTFIGDLVVELISPAGTTRRLAQPLGRRH